MWNYNSDVRCQEWCESPQATWNSEIIPVWDYIVIYTSKPEFNPKKTYVVAENADRYTAKNDCISRLRSFFLISDLCWHIAVFPYTLVPLFCNVIYLCPSGKVHTTSEHANARMSFPLQNRAISNERHIWLSKFRSKILRYDYSCSVFAVHPE